MKKPFREVGLGLYQGTLVATSKPQKFYERTMTPEDALLVHELLNGLLLMAALASLGVVIFFLIVAVHFSIKFGKWILRNLVL